MRTTTTCGVCGEGLVTPTKGEAQSNLLRHIQARHPSEAQIIAAAREQIRGLDEKRRAIKGKVKEQTGYELPGW